jgi:hypothetical protein
MSSITEIQPDDIVGDSRAVINDNFEILNEDKLENSNNLSDVSNAATARTNLGLDAIYAKQTGTDPIVITILDEADEVGLTINQNDITNGPDALALVSTGAQFAAPVLSLYNNNTESAGQTDYAGYLTFHGNDSGGTKTSFVQLRAGIEDNTNTTEKGELIFKVRGAGIGLADKLTMLGSLDGIKVGRSNANATITSNGNNDLILQTGNATTGTIRITDGADGAINLAPNGTGEAQVAGEKILTEVDIGTGASQVAAGNKGVTNGDTHDHNGGDGAQINHTTLSNIGTNTHAQIDTFIASKAAASGLASLNGSTKVVEDPANATSTATASKIPIADGSGKLDTWISDGSTSTKGKVELATDAETLAASSTTVVMTPGNFGANIKCIYKSADETVNNSTALQDDNHLIIPVGANEVWAFTMELIITTNATPDIKMGWSVPSATTMIWTRGDGLGGDGATEATTLTYSGALSADNFQLHGTIFVGATPGNVVFQWAQNTLEVSDTKVLKGSHIIAHRLA